MAHFITGVVVEICTPFTKDGEIDHLDFHLQRDTSKTHRNASR